MQAPVNIPDTPESDWPSYIFTSVTVKQRANCPLESNGYMFWHLPPGYKNHVSVDGTLTFCPTFCYGTDEADFHGYGCVSWICVFFSFNRVNCSFYFKIGACRHGDRCSRLHNKPTFSQVRKCELILLFQFQSTFATITLSLDTLTKDTESTVSALTS